MQNLQVANNSGVLIDVWQQRNRQVIAHKKDIPIGENWPIKTQPGDHIYVGTPWTTVIVGGERCFKFTVNQNAQPDKNISIDTNGTLATLSFKLNGPVTQINYWTTTVAFGLNGNCV